MSGVAATVLTTHNYCFSLPVAVNILLRETFYFVQD